MQNKVEVLILVGGNSSRYKTKSLLNYNGSSFIRRITSQFESLKINYSLDSPQSLYKLDDLKTSNIIYDEKHDVVNALYTSLSKIDSEFVFVASTDIPLISSELINILIGKALLNNISVITSDNNHIQPLLSIYKREELLNILEQMISIDDLKLKNIFKQLEYQNYDLTNTIFNKCLLNINTKTDYKQIINPFIFCVSGFKNSGKTTLINNLITLLKKDYKLAIIKHDGHDYDLSTVDTDTNKFIQSGANLVTIYSENKYSTSSIKKLEIDQYVKTLTEYDMVIIEGLKDSDYPKIAIGETFKNAFLQIEKDYDINVVYKEIVKEYNARF